MQKFAMHSLSQWQNLHHRTRAATLANFNHSFIHKAKVKNDTNIVSKYIAFVASLPDYINEYVSLNLCRIGVVIIQNRKIYIYNIMEVAGD